MQNEVLLTKVIPPHRRNDLLSRQRLMDLLYELLDYKLLIIAAPAGYGKTSLMVDFASQVEMPVCWYSLDALDRDLPRFVSHLIASISQCFPTFGSHSLPVLESGISSALDQDRVITALVNEAYEKIREHFLIVLDDFHFVNDNQEIEMFVNRLVQEAGENFHLVLVSRTLLTLPEMPLMVARNQVGGFSLEELAFRAEEIQSLVLQNYHVTISLQTAQELAQETEGWITGLLLSAQTMWQGMAQRLRGARLSGVGLYDYLAQQVLDQQTEDVRDFLLRTSFLEEFDLELCEDAFGPSPTWPDLLNNVLQNNLFVLPVGEDGRWIRYHHLFRDFLQQRFSKEKPEETNRLLQRLVDTYIKRHEWDKAHGICLRLDDPERMAYLIEQAGSSLIKGGRVETLAEWIDALPTRITNSCPNLLSMRGVASTVQGEPEQGLRAFNRAEAELRQRNEKENLARTLVRRATAKRFLGRYQAALDDAAEALQLSKGQECLRPVEAESLKVIGTTLYHMGQMKPAIERLEESLEVYTELEDWQNQANLLSDLGLAYVSVGSYQRALTYYLQALRYWQSVRNSVGQSTLLNNLGVLYHLMGDYEQAGATFEEAILHANQSGYTRMHAYTLCSIGDLYGDLEALDEAQQAYRKALEMNQQIDDRFLQFYITLAQAGLARQQCHFEDAQKLLDEANVFLDGGELSFEKGLWLLETGWLKLKQRHSERAIEPLEESIRSFEEGGQGVELSRACLACSLAYQAVGSHEAARRKLSLAFQNARGIESRHILVIAGREAKDLIQSACEVPSLAEPASTLLAQIAQFDENLAILRRRLRPHTSTIPFAPPTLTVRALGRGEVEIDGKPVTVVEWQNQRRVRELFFYLIANPGGLTKENIGLVFWPDSSTSQLKLQFKNALYRLRIALGQDIVRFEEDRYWFNQNTDYEYDVENFCKSVALADEKQDPQEKITAFQKAVELYQGAYLPEVEGSWVVVERERLQRMFIDSMISLSSLQLEAGNTRASISLCQQILDLDPCQEEAHRLAMRVHWARGNKAAVRRQFERCVKALKEELGAEPSPQTMALYKTLCK